MSSRKGPVEAEKAFRAILSSISRVEEFTNDFNQAQFEADPKTISAVCYELVTIGERVSDLNKENYFEGSPFNDQIAWDKIARQRHFLSHEYYENIDAEVLWNTLQRHMPVLKDAITWHLNNETKP